MLYLPNIVFKLNEIVNIRSSSLMLDINNYYHDTLNNEILLAYKGEVSEELFDCILHLVEGKLQKVEPDAKLKKKVFNILVEVLQNMFHHYDEINLRGTEQYPIVFILIKEENNYIIVTGNPVLMHKAEVLKNKIDTVKAMTVEELKSVYREKLNVGNVSERGGAGLGIIDIVRRSGGKIKYEFQKLNNRFSFFSLQVKVTV